MLTIDDLRDLWDVTYQAGMFQLAERLMDEINERRELRDLILDHVEG